MRIVREAIGSRYWWFQWNKYEPDVHQLLSSREKRALRNWYKWTDDTKSGIGECSIPMAAQLTGLINGNGIDSVLQIGHYTGYSSLFIASTLKRMGFAGSFISLDIDEWATKKAQDLLSQAGLMEYAELKIYDSRNPESLKFVRSKFPDGIKLIFIDSYHTYKVARSEIELWFPELCPGGLMLFHDSSSFAATFADIGDKGVNSAIDEFAKKENLDYLNVNSDVYKDFDSRRLVYQDSCGLAIIQKPFSY